MIKNKAQTKAKILQAVEDLMVEHGGKAVNINQVSKKAQVTRTIIYRYFNSLDGLMQAYADSESFWPDIDEIIGMDKDLFIQLSIPQKIRILLEGYHEALVSRPKSMAMLAWSISDSNPITQILETRRATVAVEARKLLNNDKEDSALAKQCDIDALFTILCSSIVYLGLRSMHQTSIANTDYSTQENQKVVKDTLIYILSSLETHSEKNA